MNQKEYNHIMGLVTIDTGSVPTLRKFVNKCLEKRGYKKLKGYKPLKQLIAIKNTLYGKK